MSIYRRRDFRLSIILVLLLLILFIAQRPRNLPLRQGGMMGTAVAHSYAPPPPDYDTYGKVPGNPGRTEAWLKRLYKMIAVYRNRNGGAYPHDEMTLFNAINGHYADYGFANRAELMQAFHNPDAIYSDNAFLREHTDELALIDYLRDVRLDGTKVGSAKAPGTRDVLATSDLYFHSNSFQTTDGVVERPVGFYIVLWDDGTTQRISYKQLLQVHAPNSEANRYDYAYPGEAGLPPGVLTVDEYNQKYGFKVAQGGG